MGYKHLLLSFIAIIATTTLIATFVMEKSPQMPHVLIPTLDLTAAPEEGTLLGAVQTIPIRQFTREQSQAGVVINADEHNLMICPATAATAAILGSGPFAIPSTTRLWGYEYSGNEEQNYATGKTKLNLFDGRFYLSPAEFQTAAGNQTKTDLYNQINTLGQFTGNREKKYYVMTEEDLCFKCGQGLLLAGACSGAAASSSSSSSSSSSTSTSSSSSVNSSSSSSSSSIIVDSSSSSSASSLDPHHVSISGMAFHPSTITVPVGTTVTWSNNDTINHSIVSDQGNELNSSVIPPSQTFSHAFNAVGTFAYHCSFHPSMMGTVIVTSGGASSASSSSVPSFACFEPSTTEGDAPLGVFFDPFCSDASVNHWSWDFDDGETSTDPSPFHVFVDPGSYDVTLTVASPTGSGSIVHTITASGAIVSSSSSSVSGAVCGNGTKEAGEECDDGNTNDNDACFANCRWAVPPSVLP